MATTEDSRFGRKSAIAEALALYQMIGDENIVEELRELIAVPPKIEHTLRAFARANTRDAHWIESRLMFREAVLREFECLVRDGIPASFAEVEDLELGASTETLAFELA